MSLTLTRKSRGQSAPLPVHDLTGDAPPPRAPFVASVPGAAAPLVPLNLPAALKGQARDRVARRQLRDAYGGTEAGLDIRPARLGSAPDLWTRLLITDAGDRRDWLRALGVFAPQCRAVLPDFLCLPAAPDLWVIETTATGVIARLGPEDGFAAEPDLALALLQEAARTGMPRAILRNGPARAEIDTFLTAQNLPICSDPADLTTHGVTAPARFAYNELSLDLARDPGAERAEMRGILSRLGLPFALAVLGLAGWIAAAMIETGTLTAQGLAYRQNAERILRQVMIPTGPILDIRSQVAQTMDRARTARSEVENEARPLDVLRRAGAVLGNHETTITRVSYQPGAGLVIDLQITDFAALDALVADLRMAGTEARVAQSITRENTGVDAVLAMAVTENGADR
jgi:general secretion pathway protein L